MTIRLGGSFAPPLTDECLVAYEALIEGLDHTSQAYDILRQLLAACKAWWALPESAGPGRPHPHGRGVIVDMDAAVVKALWDLVPWDSELTAMEPVLDRLECVTARQNGERAAAWQQTVQGLIVAKHFPGNPTEYHSLVQVFCKLADSAAMWLGLMSLPERELFAKKKAAMEVCRAEINQALASKTYDGLPYPTPEPTPLRNAAYHLFWHVREFARDREPITNDKL